MLDIVTETLILEKGFTKTNYEREKSIGLFKK